MARRTLGQCLEVSAVGLGCMGMTFAYGPPQEGSGARTIERALDLGATFLDTARRPTSGSPVARSPVAATRCSSRRRSGPAP